MKRRLAGLLLCAGSLAVWQLPPAQGAEPSRELTALSAEVQALKARQMAIQADVKAIRGLLAGSRPSPAAPAPETPSATPAPAAATMTTPADAAGMDAVRKEIEELKKLVAGYKKRDDKARQARLPVRDIDFTLEVASDPFKGSTDARVTLVEFTDYQCPYCGRHNKKVMPDLLKNYVETGKVRYVLRDYPLAFHKNAAKAHEAAHCAGDQGKYWEMHDQLFANQRALMEDKLPGYAEAAGVADMTTFQSCLDSGQYAERGKASLAEGAKAGVRGTPSFLLGLLEGNGSTVKAKKFIRGAQGYKVFEDAIKELLTTGEG